MKSFARKMDRHLLGMAVINQNEIDRMKDIEFLSELVISVINESVMDKKKLLNQMMTPGGVDMRRANRALKVVTRAIKLVREVLPDINETRFRKKSDFYSLAFWFASRIEDLAFAERDAKNMAGDLLRKFAVMADQDYADITNGVKVDTQSKTVAYIQSVRDGGDAKSHRQKREELLSELLKGVFEDKDTSRLFSDVQSRIVWANAKKKRCCVCRKELKWEAFEVDHVKPHSKGGKTDISNAALICKSCNSKKGNRD